MKKSLYFVAFAAFALVACNKELAPVDVPVEEEPVIADLIQTVSAFIDNSETKTNYTISGDKAAFEWTPGDQIWRFVRKIGDTEGTYTNYDHYTYSSINISGAHADFSGSAVGAAYEDTGFALYPAGVFTHSTGTSTLTFGLPATSAYNADAPLNNLVPMLGKLSGDSYTFKPVVGVIGISATNIPASATSISISSTSGGFSGNSVTMTSVTNSAYVTNINNLVGPESIGLRNNWFTAGTSRTFTFSSLDPSRTYTFYFPAPVGTYTDLTIQLFAGDALLGSVSASGISLNISRANISDIPAVIDFNKAQYANVALSGNANSFSAFIESKSPSVNKVKVALAATAAEAEAAVATSEIVLTTVGVASAQAVSGGCTTTGTYYLAYKGYDSSEAEIVSDSMPVYFIAASDVAERIGTYKIAYSKSMYPSTLPDNGDDTITFAVSDNPLKGNVMITQAFGFCWDVSESTHTSLSAYDFSKFKDGNPIYGLYNPANSNPKLIFSNIADQVFYYDAGGYPHFICEYGSNTLRFGFDSNAYNSTTYDLICWGGYLMNCYTNTSSYDMFIQQFAANKQ